MGRIGVKLSQIIPHLWFSKTKTAGKVEERTSSNSKSSPVSKNCGAKSEELTYCADDGTDMSCRVSNKLPASVGQEGERYCGSAVNKSLLECDNGACCDKFELENMGASSNSLLYPLNGTRFGMVELHREDNPNCQPPHSNNNGACFDMLELEHRLKAVRSEVKRRYYTSPLFTAAQPTPRLEGIPLDQALASDWPSMAGGRIAGRFEFGEACHLRSPNESISFGKSTSSSSDAALDRAPSSIWERGVITSEGSEVTADEPWPIYQSKKLPKVPNVQQSMVEGHTLLHPHYESDAPYSYSNSNGRLLHPARASFDVPSAACERTPNYAKFKLLQMRKAGRHYNFRRSSSYSSSRTAKLDAPHYAAVLDKGSCTGPLKAKDMVGRTNRLELQGTSEAILKREQGTGSKLSSVLDSFAMVKCSQDPWQDFKKSMVEMILEKQLHTPKDMVELLHCYLTLNDESYHGIIIGVMREVWSELFQQAGI